MYPAGQGVERTSLHLGDAGEGGGWRRERAVERLHSRTARGRERICGFATRRPAATLPAATLPAATVGQAAVNHRAKLGPN